MIEEAAAVKEARPFFLYLGTRRTALAVACP